MTCLSLSFLFLSAVSCGSSELHPRLFRPYVPACLFLAIPPTHTRRHSPAHILHTDRHKRVHSDTVCMAIKHKQHVSVALIHFIFLLPSIKVLGLLGGQFKIASTTNGLSALCTVMCWMASAGRLTSWMT